MSARKPPEIPLPEVFYDSRSADYWLRISPTRFLDLSESNLKLHLCAAGFQPDEMVMGQKAWDKFRVKHQVDKCIDYAGPLAGHKCGKVNVGGKEVLVTSQADIPLPKAGKFTFIQDYLDELLSPDAEQVVYFMHWLKIAYESLTRGVFQPGQMIVAAGPAGCGKSFLHELVTLILGGRWAKPFRYMSGKTNFNSDLAGAESLVMEDETAHSNLAARRDFGTAVKNWTVDEKMSVHAKGRDAVMLSFFRRLTLSVNSEPEYLMVLPPMDSSIMDKVMLFSCAKAKLCADRQENITRLKRELPAFLHYVLSLKIPANRRDDRFGVKAYHSPEILEILRDASDENKLEELIDAVIDSTGTGWRGTAIELQMELTNSKYSQQAVSIFRFSSACGTYLARLAIKNPARYSKVKNGGRSIWSIKEKE